MNEPVDVDLEQVVRALGEIGVGAAILGLRRVNISRRRLVDEVPAAKPLVDAMLDRIEALAAPVSQTLGAAVSALGDAVPGPAGERLRQSGDLVASMGLELLRLSGLTRRD